MATITNIKRFDNIRREAGLAWKWLSKLPQYKKDYESEQMKVKGIIDFPNNELKQKYGFYPLISPDVKLMRSHPPQEFFISFGRFLKQDAFDSGVVLKNLNYIDLDIIENPDYWKKYKSAIPKVLPKRILIEIDPTKPTTYLMSEIERYLNEVKRVYRIKDNRPRTDKLSTLYKVMVLKGLKRSEKEIKSLKEFQPKTENDKEASEKRAKRLLKKAE